MTTCDDLPEDEDGGGEEEDNNWAEPTWVGVCLNEGRGGCNCPKCYYPLDHLDKDEYPEPERNPRRSNSSDSLDSSPAVRAEAEALLQTGEV